VDVGINRHTRERLTMLPTDTVPASTVLVTIVSPDGSVESFESSPDDGMIIALDDWQWLRQDDGSWHCDA